MNESPTPKSKNNKAIIEHLTTINIRTRYILLLTALTTLLSYISCNKSTVELKYAEEPNYQLLLNNRLCYAMDAYETKSRTNIDVSDEEYMRTLYSARMQ